MGRKARTSATEALVRANEAHSRLEDELEAADTEVDRARASELRTIDIVHDQAKDLSQHDDFMVQGIIIPILAHAVGHALSDPDAKKRALGRAPRTLDPNVRFHDESEALRAWWASHGRTHDGDIERLRGKLKLGSTIQTSGRSAEPASDPHMEVVERVLLSIDRDDARLLIAAYCELEAPKQIRTEDVEWVPPGVAHCLLADWSRNQNPAGERFGPYRKWKALSPRERAERYDAKDLVALPIDTAIGVASEGGSAITIATGMRDQSIGRPAWAAELGLEVTWAMLVAHHFGFIAIDRGREEIEAGARIVAGRVRRAKRKLRDDLRAVELDVRPALVIPPASTRERAEESRDAPRAEVTCCAGAEMANGVRGTCITVDIDDIADRHRSQSWPRCPYCHCPRVQVSR